MCRFGFLRDNSNEESDDAQHYNYIHFTGQVLAQIPIHDRTVQRNSVITKNRTFHLATPRVTSAVTQVELDGTGFYWSYNHMQTKRWKPNGLDECSPADMEKDFVSFCSNCNLRLVKFFKEFIEIES